MNWDYITFRSITLAQRGESLFGRGGIGCVLQRTPRWMEDRGCGYCLQIRHKDLQKGISLLRDSRIAFSKVYRKQESGIVGEVDDALFR